jgi:hypothetical protein
MKKNVTLSADEELIQAARDTAGRENKTLNDAFREWLEDYGSRYRTAADYRLLMDRLSYAKPGQKFSRDEMNER